MPTTSALIESFREQVRWCDKLGSPFTARLLDALVDEPMRSAALMGGCAAIAQATGLPLALREIGASAGLNLVWDRFHDRLGTQPPRRAPRRPQRWRGCAWSSMTAVRRPSCA